MSELNVFKYDYSPWRYPSNWFRNIRQFFRNIHWGWQRATKGFCDRDTWWLGDYYKVLIHDSLLRLDETQFGYPGIEPWDTPEKWSLYIQEMAQHFYNAYEGNKDELYPNLYYDAMCQYQDGWKEEKLPDGMIRVEPVILDEEEYHKYQDLWINRDREIYEIQTDELKRGMAMLTESCDRLWD